MTTPTTIPGFNWREQHQPVKAASTQAVDKEALEKAFMDQAYGYVANRAGDLFQDGHRLGFEIVFANEANTRMVGLFGFRLFDRLLYAVVFFLSGEVKGYDLAYRHWVKKFCPFTPEWTRFLLDSVSSRMGVPSDRSIAGGISSQVHLERLAAPPQYQKAAAAAESTIDPRLLKAINAQWGGNVENVNPAATLHEAFGADDIDAIELMIALENETGRPPMPAKDGEPFVPLADLNNYFYGSKEAAWRAGWGQLLDEMAEQKGLPEPVLGDFLKGASADTLDKMAELLDTMPESVMTKLAAEAPEGTFDLPEPAPELLVKYAAAEDETEQAHLVRHGYFIRDKRAATSRITDTPEAFMTGISMPGIYRMLMRGGEFRKVFAAPFSYDGDLQSVSGDPCAAGWGGSEPLKLAIVDLGSKHFHYAAEAPDVLVIDEPSDPDIGGSKMPEAGKSYTIFCPEAGQLTRPVYVVGIEDGSGGVKLVRYTRGTKKSTPEVLTINKDCQNPSLRDGVLNGDARWFEVATHNPYDDGNYMEALRTSAIPGTQEEFEQWIRDHNGRKVTVSKSAAGDDYSIATLSRSWLDLTRKEAHMLLTGGMGVASSDAAAWLDAKGERCVFPKQGFATHVIKEPNFRVGTDGVFGIEVELPFKEQLPTRTEQPEHPKPRIGDAHDPSMGNGPATRGESLPTELVLSSAPEMLARLAQSSGVPHVLEHGVIGSLSKTYDSIQMVESFIPKMEDCLDSLGRCLFLYYWKPQDFEKAYGSDDMATQENDFLNAFRMLGDLVLGLLRRARNSGVSQGSPVQ